MKAYELHWEFDHLQDMDEDCSVIPFIGLEEFRFQMGGIVKCITKNEIFLRGNFNIIPQKTDFPIVDIGVPLMSNRMLELLEGIGKVELNKIKATIIRDTYLDPLFDENGNLFSNVEKNQNYQFVQVLEYSKVFDYENSSFKPLRSNPSKVGVINKLMLKRPIQGFPSIFRIEEKPNALFISESAKKLLESSVLTGFVFSDVLVSN